MASWNPFTKDCWVGERHAPKLFGGGFTDKTISKVGGGTMDWVKNDAAFDIKYAAGKFGKIGKRTAGWALVVAGITGALVAAPFINKNARDKQRYDPANASPFEREPQVTSMQAADVGQAQTLMGETPVAGDWAQKVRSAGSAAGVDASTPGLMDNLDGKGTPQVLGAAR